MNQDDTFLTGYADLQKGYYVDALVHFRYLMATYEEDLEREVPARLLSYYGLALALGEGRFHEAVTYCTSAVKKEWDRSEFYVNLARVFCRSDRRSNAVDVLTKGLKMIPRDPEILSELGKLGMRRKPVFRFLERGNILNRYVGLMISRVLFREGNISSAFLW